MSLFSAVSAWFGGSAPPIGEPGETTAAESVNGGARTDALGAARASAYQTQPIHAKSGGFLPSWKFVQPPGVGDAPQHVWATFALIPLSLDGPGDRPASYLSWRTPPTVANFATRLLGSPVDGGNLLLSGLYVPDPLESPSNDVYSGQ